MMKTNLKMSERMNVRIVLHHRVELTMAGDGEEGGMEGGGVADDEDWDSVDGVRNVGDFISSASDQYDHFIVTNTIQYFANSTTDTGSANEQDLDDHQEYCLIRTKPEPPSDTSARDIGAQSGY